MSSCSPPRATLVRKHESVFADATATDSKPAAQARNQTTSGKTKSYRILDSRRQFKPLDKAFRKNKTWSRVGQITKRTRQISCKTTTKSPRQTCTRQAQHVSQ
jgi:hypothetical protein